MFDFSWSEILLIGVVALVVIGPKDLPRVLRTVGQWTSRARAIAREFQFQLDQMVRDSELDEVRKTMNEAMATDPTTAIKNYVDPTGEIEKNLAAPELHGGTPAPSESAPERHRKIPRSSRCPRLVRRRRFRRCLTPPKLSCPRQNPGRTADRWLRPRPIRRKTNSKAARCRCWSI